MKNTGPKQRGIAILAMLAIFTVVLTTAVIAGVSLNKQRLGKQNTTSNNLSKAKDALIGFALRQTPPGQLPCPDTNGDGFSNLSAGNCTRQLGFLPHITLEIKELRDGSGSRLWYAPETFYSNPLTGNTLNSSTGTSLWVNSSLASVAVILAPGSAIGNQARSNSNPNRYLEGANGDGDFNNFTTLQNSNINDTLYSVNHSEFWNIVERQVLNTARRLLLDYKNTSNCQQFPWAAHRLSPFNSAANNEIGFLPVGTATAWGGASGCPSSLGAPAWLATHWADQIRYVFCGPSNPSCINISTSGPANADAILIAPGVKLSAQNRPSGNLDDYYEGLNYDSNLQFQNELTANHDDSYNDLLQIVE